MEHSHRLLTKLVAFQGKTSFIIPWNVHLYPKMVFSTCLWTRSPHIKLNNQRSRFVEQLFGIFYNSFVSVIQVWEIRPHMRPCTFQGRLTHRNDSDLRSHRPCQRDTQSLCFQRVRYFLTTPFSSDWSQSSSSHPGQALAGGDTQSTAATPEIPTVGSGGLHGQSGSSQMCMVEVAMPQGTLALPGERRTCEPSHRSNWNLSQYWTASMAPWSLSRPGSWEESRSDSSAEKTVLAAMVV